MFGRKSTVRPVHGPTGPTHLSFPLPSIMASRQITFAEVCEHKTEESLWIVIDNKGMFPTRSYISL